MKAIQFCKTGGPEVLCLVDLPNPEPGPGEVLVQAAALGVGKPDVLLRTGVYKWMPALPAVIGNEVTGYVAANGPGVSDFNVGQPVLVFGTGGGRHAEFTVASTDIITALPANVDLDDAVCIPNYAIAWCLLKEVAPGGGDRIVYINGAAGGVGSAVVDLARDLGMTTIAGASSREKCAFAAERGADYTIDYSRENVPQRILEITNGRGVDLALDQLIGPRFTDTIPMLAPLGTIVSFNALAGLPKDETFAAMRANLGKSPGIRCFSWHSFDKAPEERARILRIVLDRFASGNLKPAIHARMPIFEARKAHEALDARSLQGKIVLKP